MEQHFNIVKTVINGKEQPAVDARELWQALQSKQEFANWIKNRIADFEEGVDYCFNKIVKTGENVTGKQLYNEYTLTLDTAKHICMVERNEIGKKIRQYFIEIEKDYYRVRCCNCEPNENKFEFSHHNPIQMTFKESTLRMLNKINHMILADIPVDEKVLQYAWNCGRIIGKELAKKQLPEDLTEFVMSIPAGRYDRDEIYSLYRSLFKTPMSARWFWPKVRSIHPITEMRNSFKRSVVF